jgi:hypothetical protein
MDHDHNPNPNFNLNHNHNHNHNYSGEDGLPILLSNEDGDMDVQEGSDAGSIINENDFPNRVEDSPLQDEHLLAHDEHQHDQQEQHQQQQQQTRNLLNDTFHSSNDTFLSSNLPVEEVPRSPLSFVHSTPINRHPSTSPLENTNASSIVPRDGFIIDHKPPQPLPKNINKSSRIGARFTMPEAAAAAVSPEPSAIISSQAIEPSATTSHFVSLPSQAPPLQPATAAAAAAAGPKPSAIISSPRAIESSATSPPPSTLQLSEPTPSQNIAKLEPFFAGQPHAPRVYVLNKAFQKQQERARGREKGSRRQRLSIEEDYKGPYIEDVTSQYYEQNPPPSAGLEYHLNDQLSKEHHHQQEVLDVEQDQQQRLLAIKQHQQQQQLSFEHHQQEQHQIIQNYPQQFPSSSLPSLPASPSVPPPLLPLPPDSNSASNIPDLDQNGEIPSQNLSFVGRGLRRKNTFLDLDGRIIHDPLPKQLKDARGKSKARTPVFKTKPRRGYKRRVDNDPNLSTSKVIRKKKQKRRETLPYPQKARRIVGKRSHSPSIIQLAKSLPKKKIKKKPTLPIPQKARRIVGKRSHSPSIVELAKPAVFSKKKMKKPKKKKNEDEVK